MKFESRKKLTKSRVAEVLSVSPVGWYEVLSGLDLLVGEFEELVSKMSELGAEERVCVRVLLLYKQSLAAGLVSALVGQTRRFYNYKHLE